MKTQCILRQVETEFQQSGMQSQQIQLGWYLLIVLHKCRANNIVFKTMGTQHFH